MLEQRVKLVSENLARTMDRRRFLKQAGSTIFGGMAAIAAGHMVIGKASAQQPQPNPQQPACAPPGPYCNTGGGILSGCHGSSCFQHMVNNVVYQCHIWQCCYQAGCWTTASGGGYWTCCDCQCDNGSTCGCAQFSNSPMPRPDGPTIGVGA
jgi:hypothetical protein